MKANTSGRMIPAFAAFATFALISCTSDSAVVPTPALTTIAVTVPATSLVPGQTTTATAVGKDQNNVDIASGTITWSSSSAATATVSASGVITAVAPGTTQIIAASGTLTGQQSVTVVASPAVKINEVESNGGTPGDWIELYNATSGAVDISGWGVRDNDATHVIYKIPAGTTIAAGGYYIVEEAQFGFGLGTADEARLYNQFGSIVEVYAWTTHAATTYGRCPNASGAFITSTSSTKGAANDCSVAVKINEVESSGGSPGDWVELYNFGTIPVDISGFVVKDDDDTHVYTIPVSTTIAAGGYYVVEEASLGFGLGQPDAARLFNSTGTLVDSYAWATHAGVTYGRCPDATGAFVNTAASTKGAANSCGSIASVAWPGADDVTTVDGTSVFGGNLSGLVYEGTGASAVLWGARNGPGSIFRLLFNGTTWAPDAANGWSGGKTLHYPDGTGEPDTEDITYTTGSAAGLYIVAERNNGANSVSRNSILRFDPSGAATTLTATNEWNLTADLPATGANLGVEGITWIPDAFLVTKGFYDEAANRPYNPADYPNHGSGLFFVGVEANGVIYAYALNHTTNAFTRVATFATGFPAGVMALQYDRDLNYLFAVCDDGCGGLLATFEINTTAGSATLGRFRLTRQFNRPPSMPNINNEGFAIAPISECVAGKRFAYWSDDSETGGHAIRRASFPCAALP
ncbi:MAG: lamin tail domain-containing protein [bacterium]